MIYFLKSIDPNSMKYGQVKIGTTETFRNRFRELVTQYGYLQLLGLHEGSYTEEREFHKRFAAYRRKGEWFVLSDDILQFIADHTHRNIPPIPAKELRLPIEVEQKTFNRLKTISMAWGKSIPQVIEEILEAGFDKVLESVSNRS